MAPEGEAYRDLVLSQLEGLRDDLSSFRKEAGEAHAAMSGELNTLKVRVSVVETKAKVYGGLAGAIPAALIVLWDHFTLGKK